MRNPEKGMTLIVKEVTRLTVGLIFLFGIYIMLHGHITPGGGFTGGVIIALSFIHLVLAYGGDYAYKKMNRDTASSMESVGALAFLCMAVLGIFAGGVFFLNFIPKGTLFEMPSAGIIPVCNIAICMKVGAGLFLIFAVLTMFRPGGNK
jgi:multicomponent Na+:H+ antiporter subunit B